MLKREIAYRLLIGVSIVLTLMLLGAILLQGVSALFVDHPEPTNESTQHEQNIRVNYTSNGSITLAFLDYQGNIGVSETDFTEITDTNGFQRTGSVYRSSQPNGTPTVTYSLRKENALAPEALGANFKEQWMFAPILDIHSERWRLANGRLGKVFIYAGEYEVYSSNGRSIVLSNHASTPDISSYYKMLNATGREHRLGPQRVTVFVIDENRGGGPTGKSELWVGDPEIYSSSVDTVIHEHVHNGQDFSTRANMHWFYEAEATYYQEFLMYDYNEISAGRYNGKLIRKYVISYLTERVALTELKREQLHGDGSPAYSKGSLILSALDKEIRNATNGNKTMFDVSRSMRQEHDVSMGDFNRIISDEAGTNLSNLTANFAAGENVPKPRLVELHSPYVWISTLVWSGVGLVLLYVLIILSIGRVLVRRCWSSMESKGEYLG